jgi:hypothetical protein
MSSPIKIYSWFDVVVVSFPFTRCSRFSKRGYCLSASRGYGSAHPSIDLDFPLNFHEKTTDRGVSGAESPQLITINRLFSA